MTDAQWSAYSSHSNKVGCSNADSNTVGQGPDSNPKLQRTKQACRDHGFRHSDQLLASHHKKSFYHPHLPHVDTEVVTLFVGTYVTYSRYDLCRLNEQVVLPIIIRMQ